MKIKRSTVITFSAIGGALLIAVLIALLTGRMNLFVGSGASGTTSDASATAKKSGDASQEYVEKVFGKDIITIEIKADQTDWDNMIANAQNEEFIKADVTINGTLFKDVGVRPKGNSSLSRVPQSTSPERYSFRFKFDEYVDGQTCFGLDTFVVNNMFTDYTYMKEYLSYDMMRYLGVDAPLTGFADISLNGEKWGFYLAVESYADSYLERVTGDSAGKLYNVKTMNAGGVGVKGAQAPTKGRGTGGDLVYSGDSAASYSAIFDNVIGKADDKDKAKVIAAIKSLNSGSELETYFDVDKTLRYLAAHTALVSLDSYSTDMAQNYYIYEKDSKITILPWDYNASFGGFRPSSTSAVINFPIDTPVSGVTMASRPLYNTLLSNEAYKAKYHEYLAKLVSGYFSSFEEKVSKLDALISEYVRFDPSAFCTYDQYKAAVTGLKELGKLRAQSIDGQLKGTVPSTTDGQTANYATLISAGSLDINSLGADSTPNAPGGSGPGGNFPGGLQPPQR